MRTLTIRAGLFASVALAVLALGSATGFANHSWGTYHWARTSNPFTLQLGDNMTTAAWDAALLTAASDWSSTAYDGQMDAGTVVANPLRTLVVAGANRSRCGGVSGRVEVCNGKYGQNGWLGLAQIWLSNGHIVQGVTKMNDTYFNMSYYNNVNEKLHVVCQEIGHTFGLGHQSETGASLNTCMDYFSNTGANATSTQSTKPNLHDYGQLTRIYGHADSYASYSSAAVAAGSGRLNARGGGGAEGQDGYGTPQGASPERGEWYVENLGNGQQLITHVYWADKGR